MPEGDTILRAAKTMHRVLAGKQIVAAASSLPAVASSLRAIVGRTIVAVEAVGKNHLVRFDDGHVLHTHMKMTGSWHLYRPGERWQKSASTARVVLTVADVVAVCFAAPIVRLATSTELGRDDAMASLGPDILSDDFDERAVVSRMRTRDDGPIGDLVLDQRCVAGIGNIYKSESLFIAGVDPFARASVLDDDTLARVLRTARSLMRASVDDSRHTPWVYGRSGKPCRRCAETIAMERQGTAGRSTYYCARCQKVARGNVSSPSR